MFLEWVLLWMVAWLVWTMVTLERHGPAFFYYETKGRTGTRSNGSGLVPLNVCGAFHAWICFGVSFMGLVWPRAGWVVTLAHGNKWILSRFFHQWAVDRFGMKGELVWGREHERMEIVRCF